MEKRIQNYILNHKAEILDDLLLLVKQEATSADIEALAKVRDTVVSIMKKRLLMDVEVIETPLKKDVVYSKTNDEKPFILLVGHYDTVHPIGSLPIRVMDDVIMGPGVLDMKAGIIQGIWAYRCLCELGLYPKYPVHFVFNGDEEVGSVASKDILFEVSKNARCALVLEPGVENGDLKTGRKGAMNCVMKVFGKAAHAGNHPEDGINAIVEMSYQIQELQKLNDNDKRTTVNVCKISGGTKSNVIADYAEIAVDIRYALSSEKERIKKDILAIPTFLNNARKEVEFSKGSFPLEETKANMEMFTLAQKCGSQLEMIFDHQFVGGASDGNKIAQNGICVLDGLGAIGRGIHAQDEQICVSEYMKRIALLSLLLVNIK